MPPHVPSCDVPTSVFVGSGLELHCKDKLSVPPATYRWYKDNRALVPSADTPYSIDPSKGTLVRELVRVFVLGGGRGGDKCSDSRPRDDPLTSFSLLSRS